MKANSKIHALCVALFLLTFVNSVYAQVPSYVPTNGLVGWWPFNGNANDESGNGNNGTVNGATLTTDRNGNSSSAYFFSVNTVQDISMQNLQITGDWTISLWFLPTAGNVTSQNYLMGLKCQSYWAGIGQSYSSPQCGLPSGASFIFDGNQGCSNWLATSQNYSLNSYNYLCITYAGGVYSISINGQPSYSSSSLLDLDIDNIVVGRRCNDPSSFNFDGSIDDIGIWNRALSPQEITGLYTGTNPPPCNPLPSNLQTGLVGWWPFCGNANDESGNGNHGTVNGATLAADRFGNMNKAYYFNGYTNIQTLTAGPTGTGISLSYWYKTNQSIQMQTISYGSLTWGSYFGAYLNHFSAQTTGPCYGPSFTNAGTLVNKNNGSLQDTTAWHHAVIIIPVNATDLNSLTFYLDGQELVSTCSYANYGAPSPNIDNGNPIRFGGGWYSGTPYNDLVGYLDDIGFWNRALTSQEVAELYQSQACNMSFTTQPSDVYLNTGIGTQLTAVNSDTAASYQWQSNAAGLGWVNVTDNANYTDAATGTLLINNLTLANHLQEFRVVASNGICFDTSAIATVYITDTCITTVNDTVFVTVTDTLIIDAVLTTVPTLTTNRIIVYPNPASTHITVDNGNYAAMNGYSLEITNALSQVVFTSAINQQQFYIDLSSWTGNGVYHLSLKDGSGAVVDTRQIVVQ
ncbi:MAG: hypothetical protein RL213_2009 [Bacteroidota bacterium]|jgi:hypothetical protein